MYTLPSLNYEYDALGRYISKDIMLLHHTKHHQTYVDKLNAAIDAAPALRERPLESLLSDLESLPEGVRTAIRNHGGGHYNHSLFWEWMSPDGGGQPTGELAERLDVRYGDFQAFVDGYGYSQISRLSRQPTKTLRSCKAWNHRFLGLMSGSMPTTWTTRTNAMTISRRGGMSSTGLLSLRNNQF